MKTTRSINIPDTETSIRGAKDAFIEDNRTNIELIRKRIKSTDLQIIDLNIGKYTNTLVSIVYINSITKIKLVNKIYNKLIKINIDGIVASEQIKNLLDSSSFILPTIATSERPDITSNALLQGKVVIVVDNSPYVLIIPGLFYDYFKTPEDYYAKNINVTFTRIIRYIAFFIAMLTPAIYLSLTTYNFNMVPTELLINFASLKRNIYIPSFFEAFLMLISFEIIREADIRIPSKLGSSFSIVGALILGDVAVNANIIEPTMIIIIALTAISSLPFNEVDITNSLRLYRFIFMIGALFLGFFGVYIVFLLFLISISSKNIFNIPYFTPYSPLSLNGLKDSIIKVKSKIDKRNKYLSNNIVKERR